TLVGHLLGWHSNRLTQFPQRTRRSRARFGSTLTRCVATSTSVRIATPSFAKRRTGCAFLPSHFSIQLDVLPLGSSSSAVPPYRAAIARWPGARITLRAGHPGGA